MAQPPPMQESASAKGRSESSPRRRPGSKKDGRRRRRADAEAVLLSPPSKKEADRRAYISEWLVAIGVPAAAIRTEHQTDAGPVDLYLTNRRIILEVKQGGRLSRGPYADGTGSIGTESAFEQVARYVVAERARERLYLEDGVRERNWIGIATDGRVWYAWEWQPKPSDPGDAPSRISAWQGTELSRANIGRLAVLLDRGTVGREWASADMSHVFEDARSALERSFQRRRALRDVRTQQGLWLEQLRGGGNAPDADRDAMFVLHSMLILIARMISARPGDGDPRYGFVQWVGDEEIRSLEGIIAGYNWSQHTGDILRAVYRHFVPAEHRRLYGEYYTPDWLAEIVCAEVIDDGFIAEQARRYGAGLEVQGVLDPACGSGTFLYHAAKRIVGSEPVKRAYLKGDDAARLACLMVRGIDIHPVAVEMARANMRRILPDASEIDISVYQGDSLLTPRPEAVLHGGGGRDLPLVSPGGRHLILPGWFAVSDSRSISRFVESAADDADMPPSLGAGADGYDEEGLREAHGQLRGIIRSESNGVWLWYILNQAGPMRLRGTIGRIVANPPWVSYDKLQVPDRKAEVRRMAGECGLWVGGKNAKFDMAALFVDRCTALYAGAGAGGGGAVGGWVLPHGAMAGGGNWANFAAKMGDSAGGVWDIGSLAFPTKSCVMFFGVSAGHRALCRRAGSARPAENDAWAAAREKIAWRQRQWRNCAGRPAEEPSAWLEGGRSGRALATQGATIVPHCLVYASGVERGVRGPGIASVTTKPSTHEPWKSLGTMSGDVPSSWVRRCVTASNVLPYAIKTHAECILPLGEDGRWDERRSSNAFWRAAQDQYSAHCGIGGNNPKTLEARLDFNGMLLRQALRAGQAGHYVVYNKAGAVLSAARLPDIGLVAHATVYYMRCASKSEALFVEAVLNAGCMLPAFLSTRRNGRDFAAHLWSAVPVPRYDSSDAGHRRLRGLAARAEAAAAGAFQASATPAVNKRLVREAVAESGLGSAIDEACRRVLPRHAEP